MAYKKRAILGLVAASALLAPVSAQAWVGEGAADFLGRVAKSAYSHVADTAGEAWSHVTPGARPIAAAPSDPVIADLPVEAGPVSDLTPAPVQPAAGGVADLSGSLQIRPVSLSDLDVPAVPALPSVAVAELPTPSVEKPLHRLFCVEYARARSGLAVFGDAKFWWDRAKNLYARAKAPVADAVMVFSGSKRLRHGHVAVVTNIVSKREIRVDQANWQNHGEIDHSTPVLDVSAENDWSKVRVWDMASNGFGAHVYAVSGFIAKELSRTASND